MMMMMCSMAKPLWGTGKTVIRGSVLFVFQVLLVCLRVSSMEVNLAKKNIYWPTEIYGYGINANCKINK